MPDGSSITDVEITATGRLIKIGRTIQIHHELVLIYSRNIPIIETNA